MKKRLLSALLALALVFVLLPTTALADTTPVTDENVKINGTAVIVGNDISSVRATALTPTIRPPTPSPSIVPPSPPPATSASPSASR